MTEYIKLGIEDHFQTEKNIRLWIVIAVCLTNFTLWLGLWWKYYQNVEEKIVATEYILIFIPLNEINKNPKIASYIKQKILDKKWYLIDS